MDKLRLPRGNTVIIPPGMELDSIAMLMHVNGAKEGSIISRHGRRYAFQYTPLSRCPVLRAMASEVESVIL